MPQLDDIVQNLALEGNSEVETAFREIEEAAKAMFEALEAGSAVAVFASLTIAAVALTAAVFAFGVKMSEAAVETGHLAEQAGTTVSNFSAMQIALGEAGVKTDGFAAAFRRLNVSIENDWPSIVKQIETGATQAASAQLKIQDATFRVSEAQSKLSNDAKSAAQSQVDSQLSISRAYLQVQQTQAALAGGTDEFNQKLLAIDQASLAAAEAQNNLSKAQNAAVDSQHQSTSKLIADELALRAAVIARQEAQQKADDELKNSVPAIANALKGTAQSFDLADVSAKNLFEAVVLNAGKAADAAAGVFKAIPSKPTGFQVLFELADTMKNTESATTRTALAFQAFGRNVGQDLVEQLSKGSANIDKISQAVKDAHLNISDLDAHMAEETHQAWSKFSTDIGAALEKLGVAAGPLIIGLINTLTNLIPVLTQLARAWGLVGDAAQKASISEEEAARVGLSGNPDGLKFSGGGIVSGPGTETSDSIPALLSDGEAITRSRAVRYYGADFMRAINNMQLPKFAEGGLVSRSVSSPDSASEKASRPLSLTIDGRTFGGLMAPNKTANELVQFAINRQITSTGPKPRWNR